MEMQKEQIDKMLNKLKVLESKIQNIETLTNEVLNEVDLAYHAYTKTLRQKKDIAQHKLKKIQKISG
jgi:hypothetical protein